MAAFNKFNRFVEDEAEGVHNLAAHSLKALLTNVAPVAGSGLKADWTEIAAGNGYVAGGIALTVTDSSQTGGTYKLVVSDAVLTASGGAVAQFRYVIIYNDTPTSPADPGIGWYDYGAAIDLADGEDFTIDLDQVNGLLQKA